VVASLLDKARESFDHGHIPAAIEQLKKILQISRTNKNALRMLSSIYMDCDCYQDGIKLLKFCMRHYPQETIFSRYYGIFLCRHGHPNKGIKYLQAALQINPNDLNTQHLLQAAKHDSSLNTNIGYVENLFNNYADNFERSLSTLKYSGHTMLISYLVKTIGQQFAQIIDLGCGTGLVGEQIKQQLHYNYLAGVDIAEKMLAKANHKNIYNELFNMEIVAYLQQALQGDKKFDLIVSADVFLYIGELSELFTAVSKTLSHNGYFAFTVEDNSHNSDYFLNITGRFSHSKQYIINTLIKTGFKIIAYEPQILRYELGKTVNCYMYIASLNN
jgi:predicted TPR repeat methyltransferase